MEEERQARAKVPEPRVPVVSRPTAARTQHMAEIARTLSTRQSCSDDHGRVLCPAYPVSTVNAPVPSVLAEALLQGTRAARGGGSRGDDGGSSRDHPSRGSSKGGVVPSGGLKRNLSRGLVGEGREEKVQIAKSFESAARRNGWNSMTGQSSRSRVVGRQRFLRTNWSCPHARATTGEVDLCLNDTAGPCGNANTSSPNTSKLT